MCPGCDSVLPSSTICVDMGAERRSTKSTTVDSSSMSTQEDKIARGSVYVPQSRASINREANREVDPNALKQEQSGDDKIKGGKRGSLLLARDKEARKQMERESVLKKLAMRFDRQIKIRDNLLAVNATLSILVMIGLFFVNFECEKMDIPDPRCGEAAEGFDLRELCYLQCKIVSNSQTQACKGALTLLTIILVLQEIEYYKFQMKVDKFVWKNPAITWGQSERRKQCYHELLYVVWHIPPVLNTLYIPMIQEAPISAPLFNDRANLVVWFRLFFFLRVIRNYTRLHCTRDTISLGCLEQNYPVPHFTTFLAIKSLLHLKGKRCLCFLLFISGGIMMHFVHVLEREAGYSIGWNYGGSMWFIAETITTLGYGDFIPMSNSGRAAAVVACIIGVCLTSFVIAIINNMVTPAKHQLRAIQCMLQNDSDEGLKEAAIQYTQLVWRYKVYKMLAGHREYTAEQKRQTTTEFAGELVKLAAELRKAKNKVDLLADKDVPPDMQLLKILDQLKTVERNNQLRQKEFLARRNKLNLTLERLETVMDTLAMPNKGKLPETVGGGDPTPNLGKKPRESKKAQQKGETTNFLAAIKPPS